MTRDQKERTAVNECEACGHRWSLHDGCCRWRGGINDEDFCLCIAEEPVSESGPQAQPDQETRG